jgi:hypothetical protein
MTTKIPDGLVPDPAVWKELNICAMTGYRWDRNPAMMALGWPLALKINSRKYRSRAALEAFKTNLAQRAIQERDIITRRLQRKAARE